MQTFLRPSQTDANLLRQGNKKEQIQWISDCNQALESLKNHLATLPQLETLIQVETHFIYIAASKEAINIVRFCQRE